MEAEAFSLKRIDVKTKSFPVRRKGFRFHHKFEKVKKFLAKNPPARLAGGRITYKITGSNKV